MKIQFRDNALNRNNHLAQYYYIGQIDKDKYVPLPDVYQQRSNFQGVPPVCTPHSVQSRLQQPCGVECGHYDPWKIINITSSSEYFPHLPFYSSNGD